MKSLTKSLKASFLFNLMAFCHSSRATLEQKVNEVIQIASSTNFASEIYLRIISYPYKYISSTLSTMTTTHQFYRH